LLQQEYADKLDAKAGEYLCFARQSVDRMHALIDDLRTVARVTTGGKPLKPVDCQEVLDAALTNLTAEIDQSGARVTHDELPTVMADSTQLMQLLQNLIGNGIKYCKDRSPEIHVGADPADRDWQIGVSDNGIGVTAADQDRIFEIFQRGHVDEGEYSGTGVGLAVCKRIVQRHGGRIWVQSEPGKGSTFRFTMRGAK
jgi:light-regulated signal transduction histidine kinase (bacteriophytochrome)